MTRKIQIAVQMDPDLLERVDKRIGRGRGSSRSEYMRQAAELMLALEEQTDKWTAEGILAEIDRRNGQE